MASSSPSITPSTCSRIPRSLSVECRPKLLKDFLTDDHSDFHHSSPPFRSFQAGNALQSRQLITCRSKAASTTISAIYKASEIVSNVVKHLPFATRRRSPAGILRRSISRRLSKHRRSSTQQREETSSAPVKVKDILRWKSFRDLAEESVPGRLDLPQSPAECTATTNSTTASSKRSNWCDSDFTAEDLPSWCGNCEEGVKNRSGDSVGGHCTTRQSTVDTQGEYPFDEKEQNSPVSVLDSPFEEYEESLSSFHRSLANMERRRCMLMQKIQEFEELAQLEPVSPEISGGFECEDANESEVLQAMKLLQIVKGECSEESLAYSNRLLLDLSKNGWENDDEAVVEARRWMEGEWEGLYEWEVECNRVEYLKEMERAGRWSKFDEDQEKEKMSLELESQMIEALVDDVLLDFLAC